VDGKLGKFLEDLHRATVPELDAAEPCTRSKFGYTRSLNGSPPTRGGCWT
jgi:hypothetical protein